MRAWTYTALLPLALCPAACSWNLGKVDAVPCFERVTGGAVHACFATDEEAGIIKAACNQATEQNLNLLGGWSFEDGQGVGHYKSLRGDDLRVDLLYIPNDVERQGEDIAQRKKALVEVIVEE